MISIVIVCLNAAKTIKAAIESIIKQDYPYYEILIKDGASTDNTRQIIESYNNKINHFISDADNGIYDAMNRVIEYCNGRFVYFLGADDELYASETLSDMFSLPVAGQTVLYGNVMFRMSRKVRYGKMSAYKLSKHNISQQCIFYPREVFKKYRFDISYPIMADYAFNLELFFSSSYCFEYRNVIISDFNDSGLSQTTRDFRFEQNKNSIIKRIVPDRIFIRYWLRQQYKNIAKLWDQKD